MKQSTLILSSLILILFTMAGFVTANDLSVPWSTEQYTASAGAMAEWRSDYDEAYGPPLPIYAQARASVDESCANGRSDITDSTMSVSVHACNNAYAEAHASFTGVYIATTPELIFSYETTDGWIIVYDRTYRYTIEQMNLSGNRTVEIPVTVGNEIEVQFGLDAEIGYVPFPGYRITQTFWYDVSVTPEQIDSDGDGVPDDSDICPGGDDTLDNDSDLIPDFCDPCPYDSENDADGDGICESDDNCPLIANEDQFNTDGDLEGDICDDDDDNDGISDVDDNCQYDFNPEQADYDRDGYGSVCDTDDDNDGILDATDQCVFTMPGEAVNDTGCSIADLCQCDNPWKNHGAYVRCVAHTSEDFVADGLITEMEKDTIVSEAGGSSCGHNN